MNGNRIAYQRTYARDCVLDVDADLVLSTNPHVFAHTIRLRITSHIEFSVYFHATTAIEYICSIQVKLFQLCISRSLLFFGDKTVSATQCKLDDPTILKSSCIQTSEIWYLRSPEMCMLEKIFTSPPESRTDSTKCTYSLRKAMSLQLEERGIHKIENMELKTYIETNICNLCFET